MSTQIEAGGQPFRYLTFDEISFRDWRELDISAGESHDILIPSIDHLFAWLARSDAPIEWSRTIRRRVAEKLRFPRIPVDDAPWLAHRWLHTFPQVFDLTSAVNVSLPLPEGYLGRSQAPVIYVLRFPTQPPNYDARPFNFGP